MNLDFFSDQIDITPDSEPTSTSNQRILESQNNQIAASLLPPLPSQSKIKQTPSASDNSNIKTIHLPAHDQVHTDNSKRISDLVYFPVPNIVGSQNDENHMDEPDDAKQQESVSDNSNKDYHEPVINNKYKRSSFSKLNSDRSKNNSSTNSSSSVTKNLNTCEPTGLYSSANFEESSPTDLTPKSDQNSNKCTTELVIDNGFVIHDPPIKTESKKESIQKKTTTQNMQNYQDNQPKSSEKDTEKEEAINAMKQFLNNNIIPPIHLQPLVTRMIRSEVVKATMEEDYNRASDLENAMNLLSTAIEWRVFETNRKEAKKTIKGRYTKVKQAYENEAGEWKKIFTVFRDQQKENQEKLEKTHNDEIKAFEQKWSTSTNMFKYNKPSPSLLQLRKIQKNLAIAHQFDEAKRVKLTADMQQMRESEEAKKRAEQTMINEYDALVEKQKREKKCFFDRQRTTELFLKNQQGRVLQPLEMQMKQLQTTINKDKPTNLKPVKYTFTSTAKTKIAASELKQTSPRITGKFSRFKKNEEAQKLTINGLDVRKIISKKRGSSVTARIRI